MWALKQLFNGGADRITIFSPSKKGLHCVYCNFQSSHITAIGFYTRQIGFKYDSMKELTLNRFDLLAHELNRAPNVQRTESLSPFVATTVPAADTTDTTATTTTATTTMTTTTSTSSSPSPSPSLLSSSSSLPLVHWGSTDQIFSTGIREEYDRVVSGTSGLGLLVNNSFDPISLVRLAPDDGSVGTWIDTEIMNTYIHLLNVDCTTVSVYCRPVLARSMLHMFPSKYTLAAGPVPLAQGLSIGFVCPGVCVWVYALVCIIFVLVCATGSSFGLNSRLNSTRI